MSSAPIRRSGTQTVERSFQILKEIAARNKHGAAMPDLIRTLSLHRTTLHRLVHCLVRQGAVRQDRTTKRFHLGPLALELGVAARSEIDPKALFASAVQRIAEKTADTTFLMLRSGNDAVCIDRRLGSYPIKTIVVEIGTRRPLGIGAGSLAMLGALSRVEIERVVSDNAHRLSAYDMKIEELVRRAQSSHRAGYAAGPVYGVEGAVAVGVPILDGFGSPVAAISVAAISRRMTQARQREILNLLQEEASATSRLLAQNSVIDT